MIQRITADENVVLVPPGQDGFRSVCFPEGLNFVLRLPVVPYDRITEIESHLRDISIHVDILGIYGGQVITTGQGRLIHYFARFVDFSATLWHLEETLNFIHDEGLVPPYPQLGLYILDPLDAAPGSFKVYLGEEGTRMEGYAFLLDRPGDIHVIEAEEIITSAVNPMKKVRKKLSTQSKANVDPGRGIYRGVISQNSIMEEAMDDFSFDYEKPHCPKCGREVSADPLEQYDFLCTRCNHGSRAEDAYPDRPLGFLYDAEGYFLTNCADGDILVLRSNFYTLAQLSSSHEPGAGNLEAPVEDGVKTYCLGHDWFEGGIAPYPVYRVSDDVQIVGAKVEMVYDSEDTDMVKQSNHGF